MGDYVNRLMNQLVAKNPGEAEFHQAVHEVAESVEMALARNPRYVDAKIFERIVEPERVVMFRVPWTDDSGQKHRLVPLANAILVGKPLLGHRLDRGRRAHGTGAVAMGGAEDDKSVFEKQMTGWNAHLGGNNL